MQVKDLQMKRVSRAALFILLVGAVGMTKGYAVTIGDLNYNLDNTTLTATITSHKDGVNATGNLTIPSTVTYTSYENDHYVTRTYTVTAISGYYVYNDWKGAFQDCSGLTGSLNIPNTMTSIGRKAFYGCSGFTGILTIPNSVTSIGIYAFENCSGFMAVHYNASNCSSSSYMTYINNSWTFCPPFGGCGGSLIIGNNIDTIPEYLFSGGNFSGSLTIPNSVISIGNHAFYGCSDFSGNLTISNSVTTIDDFTFYGCSGFTGDLFIPSSVTTISRCAFENCSGFTGNLTIPNSVTSIGNDAFRGCSGFMGCLTIPNSLTTIGTDAFKNCSGFTEVDYNATYCTCSNRCPFSGVGGALIIGDNVEIIPNYMFSNTAFTGNLTIPNSVTYIGTEAFGGCTSFTGSLTIGNSVTLIANRAFKDCSGFTGNLSIPNSMTTIMEYAFYGCSGFTGNLIIPDLVTTIGNYAFYGCTGFTGSLTIGNSVTAIGMSAFDGCSGFSDSLTIGNSVTTIDNSAFNGCNGFTEVHYNAINALDIPSTNVSPFYYRFGGAQLVIGNNVERIPNRMFYSASFTGNLIIPNSVTSIGSESFSYCTGFSGNLIIGNSVTTIGANAFQNCTGFTGNLILPNTLISIGNNAFRGCRLIGSLTIPNSVTSIGVNAFLDCNRFNGSLTIGNSVTTIGTAAFEGCRGFMGNLTLGSSVTTIGNSAFNGCRGFTGSLTIPNSVISIGEHAFQDCVGFTGNLTLSNTLTSIGNYAFYGCSGLTSMTVLEDNPPTLGNYAFYSVNKGIPVYVPYGFLEAYQNAQGWNEFTNFQPIAYKSILGYGQSNGNWRFIAFPLTGNTAPTEIDGLIPMTGTYDLYRFNQSVAMEWENYKAHTQCFVLENGQGYLYANAEDVNIIFKGAFNEGETKEVSLVYDANAEYAGWNLVGNPFPVSAYANKSYYTMNEDGTAIEPVAVSSTTVIPVCTGVMVKAETTGESVIFSKTAPEAAANQGVLQIAVAENTRSNAIEDRAIVSFNVGDALEKFVFNANNAQLYIPQKGKDFAIVCAAKQGEMPLNFKAVNNGTYTFSVCTEYLELNYLHLIDNLIGADVDLLANPSYTFDARTTDYASRFKLVFTTGNDDNEDNFAFFSNGSFVISNEGNATLQVVDVTGRIIMSETINGCTSVNIDAAPGVYMLRLINGNDVKVQKIVVR